MKMACAKWKDDLLEAGLSGRVAGELENHLSTCARCAEVFAMLQTRRERMDALLPLLAHGAEPSPDIRARVLAKVQNHRGAKRVRLWRTWVLAGAVAAILAAAVIPALYWRREAAARDMELTVAQKLTDWRAPSDVLLETPGKEFLRATPRLGESYIRIPSKVNEED